MIYVVALSLVAKILTRKLRRANDKYNLDYLAEKGYVVATMQQTEEKQREYSEAH